VERHGQAFRDQDFANVAPGRFERPAPSSVIAAWRPFRAGWTRARNELKIETAGPDKITNSSRGLVT
jgi:hypothetical protein